MEPRPAHSGGSVSANAGAELAALLDRAEADGDRADAVEVVGHGLAVEQPELRGGVDFLQRVQEELADGARLRVALLDRPRADLLHEDLGRLCHEPRQSVGGTAGRDLVQQVSTQVAERCFNALGHRCNCVTPRSRSGVT